MRKFFTTAAILATLVAPASAKDSNQTRAACVLGWAALSIVDGSAKTVEAAKNAGLKHCRHIKPSFPKDLSKEDREEVEGDRAEELNSTVQKIFDALKR